VSDVKVKMVRHTMEVRGRRQAASVAKTPSTDKKELVSDANISICRPSEFLVSTTDMSRFI